MSPEDKKWLEDQVRMFETQGWQDLMEKVRDQQASIGDVRNASSEDLDHRKGRLSVLDWLTSWEGLCSDALQRAVDEELARQEPPAGDDEWDLS